MELREAPGFGQQCYSEVPGEPHVWPGANVLSHEKQAAQHLLGGF